MNKYYLEYHYYKEPKTSTNQKRLEENVKHNLLEGNYKADKPNEKWCTFTTSFKESFF